MNDETDQGEATPEGEGHKCFESDDGWGPLISELEVGLKALSPGYRPSQVKEKFGCYGISVVNPNRIHLTVGKQRRFRRTGGDDYVVHYEDLTPKQIGWWEEIPTVTARTAIEQCLADGTPTYLLRQAIERGHAQGYLTAADRDALADELAQ